VDALRLAFAIVAQFGRSHKQRRSGVRNSVSARARRFFSNDSDSNMAKFV
jgi:hypothetical protein